MAKTIKTIDDLAKIAGAELGQKTDKIEALAPSKPKKPSPSTPSTPSKKPAKPAKPGRPTKHTEEGGIKSGDKIKGKTVDHLSDIYNAFDIGYIKYYPNRKQPLDEIRNRPNPVNANTRGHKAKDLPKLIKAEWKRVEHFKQVYLNGLSIGHNNTGYVHASIMAEREALRLEAYLKELTEKA